MHSRQSILSIRPSAQRLQGIINRKVRPALKFAARLKTREKENKFIPPAFYAEELKDDALNLTGRIILHSPFILYSPVKSENRLRWNNESSAACLRLSVVDLL